MCNRLSLFGAVFVSAALSTTANSQTILSFSDCSNAVAAVSRYTDAAIDRSGEQYLTSQISEAQHAHRVQALQDFQTNYSLEQCMQGEATEVFQCILQKSGELELCRK